MVALIGKLPNEYAIAAGVAVAAMQACEQVFKLSSKARDHSGLASEFSALERQIALSGTLTKQAFRELQADRLAIEAREPSVKRYLDLICHNQVARAYGYDDLEKLKFWQVWFAQYLPGDRALQDDRKDRDAHGRPA